MKVWPENWKFAKHYENHTTLFIICQQFLHKLFAQTFLLTLSKNYSPGKQHVIQPLQIMVKHRRTAEIGTQTNC